MQCNHVPCAVVITAACVAGAAAQPAPVETWQAQISIDSGFVINTTGRPGAAFEAVVAVPDAAWIILTLDEVILGAGPPGATPTTLRIESALDGAVQHHTAETLRQWGNTSAVFNGGEVTIEIIADPGAERSRIVMTQVLYGPMTDGGVATICGPTDDRVPSSDPRVARTFPDGCTAWMISDTNNCFLSAGHCGVPAAVHFNVPFSNTDGSLVFPPPEDQYAVDPASGQAIYAGLGNDWSYFGAFPNTETGLTPYEAQGAAFDLADPPPLAGQTIRITGHGTDTTPLEWNQVQQTHTGPYVAVDGSRIDYVVDTTGGNSGSPVINEDTGEAIGIHTNGGCDPTGGTNIGTGANSPDLQAALADPEGVCLLLPMLAFDYPEGIPLSLPWGGAVVVVVSGDNGGTPEPGTGVLHYDAGEGFISLPMDETAPNAYRAGLPLLDCGTEVRYYMSAETDGGEVVNSPLLAPDDWFTLVVGQSVFADTFETDQGWTVTAAGGLIDGQWERGTPISGCFRGNPQADADKSGQCYVTDNSAANACNSDVDGGSTILTSPVMDASLPDSAVRYWRWYDNSAGSSPMEDVFVVEVSDNGGADWVELETVGPTGPEVQGGWTAASFPVAGVVNETDQFRIRFTASDLGNGSVVEAGVDGVVVFRQDCVVGGRCPWDCDGGGDAIVSIVDLLALLGQYDPQAPSSCTGGSCDFNTDGCVDVSDLLKLLAHYDPAGVGCP